MKKFYFYSKDSLQFVEIKDFPKKFISLIFFFTILVTFFFFGSFLVISDLISPNSEVKSLKKNNALLEKRIQEATQKFKKLDSKLAALIQKSHDLRLKANLEPLTSKESFGMGGIAFIPFRGISFAGNNDSFKDAQHYIDKIISRYKAEKLNYDEIENSLKQQNIFYSSVPVIQPCDGFVYDDFGMRLHPILKIRRMHNGVDIKADRGTKVFAPGDGTVEFAGWQNGFGWTIEINHGFGYKTLYGHLSRINVQEGQKITRGDFIALTGSSGSLTSGPHLHYEVIQNGIAVDPKELMYSDITIQDVVKKQ